MARVISPVPRLRNLLSGRCHCSGEPDRIDPSMSGQRSTGVGLHLREQRFELAGLRRPLASRGCLRGPCHRAGTAVKRLPPMRPRDVCGMILIGNRRTACNRRRRRFGVGFSPRRRARRQIFVSYRSDRQFFGLRFVNFLSNSPILAAFAHLDYLLSTVRATFGSDPSNTRRIPFCRALYPERFPFFLRYRCPPGWRTRGRAPGARRDPRRSIRTTYSVAVMLQFSVEPCVCGSSNESARGT